MPTKVISKRDNRTADESSRPLTRKSLELARYNINENKSGIFIVSDLHLGSKHFEQERFKTFIATLPDNALLLLNGDTIDMPSAVLPASHDKILNWLCKPPNGIRVIFIEGNHDRIENLRHWGIHAEPGVVIDNLRILITHGASFDNFIVTHKLFIQAFRVFHHLRISLGARPVHVAEYAKRWRYLYAMLCRNVRRDAILCARSIDCNTVVCGHVHSIADVIEENVRYINTGAWTEPDTTHFLQITDREISLHHWPSK